MFPYKTILVTGATAGIGMALVDKLFAEQDAGVFVIAAGRRKDRLDELAAKYGPDRIAIEAVDVSDLTGLPVWVDSVINKYPTLDCVVFNAGFQQSLDFANPESVPLDNITAEMTTNYLSPVHSATLFLPHLNTRMSAIVFVSSGLSLIPISRCPNYCASKAALHSFAWTLRTQLEEAGAPVRVLEIIPPAVQTELHTRQGLAQTGMPLKDFIDETWAGLTSPNQPDEIIVASLRDFTGKIEDMRRSTYVSFNKRIKEQMIAATDASN